MEILGCLLFLGILAAAALGLITAAGWLIVWFLRAVGLIGPARHKAYSRAKNKRGQVHEREDRREDGREPSSVEEILSPLQLWRKEFGAFRSERDPVAAALLQYVGDAVLAGMDARGIETALTAKGWASGEVEKGLAEFNAFLSAHPLPARD